ncbi:MAG: transketolase C-terminal domain-containing protein [Pseudomonadota bacterium]
MPEARPHTGAIRIVHPTPLPAVKFDKKKVYHLMVEKTGRILVVNEDTEVTNYGEHIIRRVLDECFYFLQAPPRLLAGANVPGIASAWSLEKASVPQEDSILDAMLHVVAAAP